MGHQKQQAKLHEDGHPQEPLEIEQPHFSPIGYPDHRIIFDVAYLPTRRVMIARILNPAGHSAAVGVAICSPEDAAAFNDERGQEIALGRALAEMDGRAVERRAKRAADRAVRSLPPHLRRALRK